MCTLVQNKRRTENTDTGQQCIYLVCFINVSFSPSEAREDCLLKKVRSIKSCTDVYAERVISLILILHRLNVSSWHRRLIRTYEFGRHVWLEYAFYTLRTAAA